MRPITDSYHCNFLLLSCFPAVDGDLNFLSGETFQLIPGSTFLFELVHSALLLLAVEGHASWDRSFILIQAHHILDLFAAVGKLQRVIGLSAEVLRWGEARQHRCLTVTAETIFQDGCEFRVAVPYQTHSFTFAESVDHAGKVVQRAVDMAGFLEALSGDIGIFNALRPRQIDQVKFCPRELFLLIHFY